MHRDAFVLSLLLLVGGLVAYIVWVRPRIGTPLLTGIGVVTLLLALWKGI